MACEVRASPQGRTHRGDNGSNCRVSSSHTLQPEGTSVKRKARSMAPEKSKAHEGFLTLLTNHGYSSFWV